MLRLVAAAAKLAALRNLLRLMLTENSTVKLASKEAQGHITQVTCAVCTEVALSRGCHWFVISMDKASLSY
jgi:hypothetical protein